MARPQLQIDERKVEALAAEGCTAAEIAAVLDVHTRTIERRFAVSVQKGREKLGRFLKRELVQQVKAGNLGAVIFGLKCYCGLKEPRDDGVTVNVSQQAITLNPAQVKANLAELQKIVLAEAKRLNFVNGNGNGSGEH